MGKNQIVTVAEMFTCKCSVLVCAHSYENLSLQYEGWKLNWTECRNVMMLLSAFVTK